MCKLLSILYIFTKYQVIRSKQAMKESVWHYRQEWFIASHNYTSKVNQRVGGERKNSSDCLNYTHDKETSVQRDFEEFKVATKRLELNFNSSFVYASLSSVWNAPKKITQSEALGSSKNYSTLKTMVRVNGFNNARWNRWNKWPCLPMEKCSQIGTVTKVM